ncbi:Glutamate formiminotransferase [Acidisarcina polymorpha]|uniref:glutamate formimidoyltransferase n=1 Tax=Acidisarcina polymorpha TaxID=2211140 RepID=A0A2Z5FVF1_9BACT|nr:glutamate formimidoyltransferase [Acidisarcina polymorpha]AXC10396.1 Glutamate formiminotransferase [Acidisarcina polymorpha]
MGQTGVESADTRSITSPQVVIECVPNFSEGLDERKVCAIIAAMRTEGVSLLDWSRDADHNRSVVTIAGSPAAVVEAALRGVGKAAELIDLSAQQGVHPRIGAADVVPFVPISGISLEQCALLARQAGTEIWRRYGVPVYFYEAAAARPDRALLEEVRRGQFEGLRDAVERDAARRPDVGGPQLHPTAGASAVGARRFLIAYNVYLNTGDVATARAIAREIRASGGGLSGVKAMGVVAQGQAQISMNVTDFRATPVAQVYAAVKQKASRHRVKVVRGELIGLVPEAAYEQDSEWVRQLVEFDPEEKILERKLQHPLEWPKAL